MGARFQNTAYDHRLKKTGHPVLRAQRHPYLKADYELRSVLHVWQAERKDSRTASVQTMRVLVEKVMRSVFENSPTPGQPIGYFNACVLRHHASALQSRRERQKALGGSHRRMTTQAIQTWVFEARKRHRYTSFIRRLHAQSQGTTTI